MEKRKYVPITAIAGCEVAKTNISGSSPWQQSKRTASAIGSKGSFQGKASWQPQFDNKYALSIMLQNPLLDTRFYARMHVRSSVGHTQSTPCGFLNCVDWKLPIGDSVLRRDTVTSLISDDGTKTVLVQLRKFFAAIKSKLRIYTLQQDRLSSFIETK